MIFTPLSLPGSYIVDLQTHEDDRGSFARAFCREEFANHGLESDLVQANICFNNERGIVRGMHFQRAPNAEDKLVRCIAGSIFDVVVDNRPESSTFGHWVGEELSAENGRMMYVPKGFAHGYQTLVDGAVALYLVTAAYAPEAEGGLRFDDPAIGIEWPLEASSVSEKDEQWPLITG